MNPHRAMCVVDGNGNQCTAGLPSAHTCDAAIQAAQRIANDRGEPVWLSWEGIGAEADDANDQYAGDGMRFDPQAEASLITTDPIDGDPRDCAPKFRIVEVAR